MKTLNLFLLASIFLFSNCEKEDGINPDSMGLEAIRPGLIINTIVIEQFTWLKGNSSWKQASKDRLWSSKFRFSSGNAFTYTFDWDHSNTYSLRGEYFKGSGSSYSFYAVRNTNNGAGSGTQIIIEGTIKPISNGKFQVAMEYGSSANYSATVNNQQFFSQASKRFKTIMIME